MGSQGGNGGRQAGRGQLATPFWLVGLVALVFAFMFLFVAFEQTSSVQKPLSIESVAQEKFENMLGKFLLSPKNNNTHGSANRDVRDVLKRLCANSTSMQPASQFTGQRPEICDMMEAKKRMGALKKEKARLHEIMQNATFLMDLRKDWKEDEAVEGSHPYFMSSLDVTDSIGTKGQFEFPSKASLGRLLCVQGNDRVDGAQNKYGFAWKEHLPPNATLLPGLTLIVNNNWEHDAHNIFHGFNFISPFALWRSRGRCSVPERLLVYTHWQVVDSMMPWMGHVIDALFGRKVPMQTLDEQLLARGKDANSLACFESALVSRHWISGDMHTRSRIFETMKCRARAWCGVKPPSEGGPGASEGQVTLVLRERSRAFKDPLAWQRAIEKAIQERGNARLEVATPQNLSFCEQVDLYSRTDVLISAHGAQITNMIFMPKGGFVMENQPFGWEEFGGQGQYVFTWLSQYLHINHEGFWFDPEGEPCPHPKEDVMACFFFHKDGQLGLDETHLIEWTSTVLKKLDGVIPPSKADTHGYCPCEVEDREQRPGPS